jgi:rubrerythrin
MNDVFRDIDAPDGTNRAQFLRRAGVSGLALASGGTILATITSSAQAQVTDLDGQIATAAAAAELLAVNTYTVAIRSGLFKGGALTYLKTARGQEQDHYDALAALLKANGATPPKASDYTYKYPKFKSAKDVVAFAVALETAFVGAYVLAAGVLSTPELRSTAAAIGANEGSHLGFFTGASGKVAVAPTLPKAARSLDAVKKTVGTYQRKK